MRFRHLAYVSLMALALAGCNDTLESASVDLSTVKNKVEQPLPSHILADMTKKGMDRNSPIMIRIFKEEGVMEILKANQSNRFEVIADYKICAWSGRLGPKVKEGDRQAPEGFYMLTPANLNPNSKYYLAINTGFPNRYDAANGRSGANLMIHGACSSSGCYSMTDQQVLEIYAFARDAFKGGQKAIQLEAFPFRMTAENMVKHRLSPNIEFWKMLKVGYDNFEVTKRPPEVEVCEKKYVFNQQATGPFNAGGKCPVMTTPPALQTALLSHDKQYDADYSAALKKYDGMAWYDPTEAERKAIVAKQRKGHDLAYAPTGTALAAGKMMKVADLETMMSNQSAQQVARGTTVANPTTASIRVAGNGLAAQPAAPAGGPVVATAVPVNVPIPTANPMVNPLAYAPPPVETAQTEPAKKPPFWKFWAKSE
ncbi:murein L,D-transpeptidase [Rhizobium sp. CB3171]|uniref:L,D-transpeptidase family protein n=1 Tax=unclassified Rhizobium TaxID=2613769 RepID=UPI0024B11A3F|nr:MULTISPECIES: murein L,D-transpeptidase family protein [unclassified Rhizobium]MDK4739798.1 murein L,D-transpeptidase [Rhizobium sp. CNPSo 3464]WFU01373.1 murein L,D-transpeptidase [Rhizobium sp. CB3171]